jgi:hypothetical protein
MSISDVTILEDNTTTQSRIKRGEKTFYGIHLKGGDTLLLTLSMKGDLTFKIFFNNKRDFIKTMHSGTHTIRFLASADGFYQCILETIEGAHWNLDCDVEASRAKRRKEDEHSFLQKLSLGNLLVIFTLFIVPSITLYLFLNTISLAIVVPLFLAAFILHEMMEEKELFIIILYAANIIFGLLIPSYVYLILGWHDAERLLLVLIYLLALMLAVATCHLFLRKVVRYGK